MVVLAIDLQPHSEVEIPFMNVCMSAADTSLLRDIEHIDGPSRHLIVTLVAYVNLRKRST